MKQKLPNGLADSLLWSEELGMGWHPRKPMEYEGSYFDKYQDMDATDMGAALTQARVEMVRRHTGGEVVDVGIGGGRFVLESGGKGFDVNEDAVAWMRDRGLYADPYYGVGSISCWDSLEHIPEPECLIEMVRDYVFVSMPIYDSAADCLDSKHFKPGEHIWYWTHSGLIKWFRKLGFKCVEVNNIESQLGREGITSYAFRRAN